jgi:hypothetical protein
VLFEHGAPDRLAPTGSALLLPRSCSAGAQQVRELLALLGLSIACACCTASRSWRALATRSSGELHALLSAAPH